MKNDPAGRVSVPAGTTAPVVLRRLEYSLYYDPYYDFTQARCEHAAADHKIAAEVRALVKSIDEHGLRNPLFVTIYEAFHVVHPGKCRVKALKLLGHDTAPALLYVPSGVNRIPSGQLDELTPHSAASLFSGDVACEWDDRFFAVKRTNRPR